MKLPAAPYAIAMWDFSWLERRWPGAGYEDWGRALDELAERGYDAVRIDAYPHLIHAGPEVQWELLPAWNQEMWGAPALVKVQLMPALLDFMTKARERGIRVALSTWFREDRANTRMRIRTPEDHGMVWLSVLDHVRGAGLLDTLIYVDLCNEFPIRTWTPFLYTNCVPAPSSQVALSIRDPLAADWMRRAIAVVKAEYPDIPCTFSQVVTPEELSGQDVGALDFLEPHVWMTTVSDFHQRIGYDFTKFSPIGYEVLVAKARKAYEEERKHYDDMLFGAIDRLAEWSRSVDRYLLTTEAWSLVCYKDWPGLEWDWLLDLNARAVERAAATGRWIGLCTSNFTGPQFDGVWRELEHHRRLTTIIRSSSIERA